MDGRAQKPHKSKTGKKSPCDQHTSPTAKPPEPDTSYARGGRVKKTGAAKLHKDEVVLPVAVVKRLQPFLLVEHTQCLLHPRDWFWTARVPVSALRLFEIQAAPL